MVAQVVVKMVRRLGMGVVIAMIVARTRVALVIEMNAGYAVIATADKWDKSGQGRAYA